MILYKALILLLIIPFQLITAQDSKFLSDKPGKFIIHNQINKCPGTDIVTLSKNLNAITEWIHLNSLVFNPPVGYDASVSFSGNSCEITADKLNFGIQCRINFSFHYFYIENGKFLTATDWAAHDIEININNPISQIGYQYDETESQSDDPPRLKQSLEKALENLRQYYNSAPVEKEIAPGVRLYAGGHLLVFNPGRPDIWIPVTVKEIMEAKLAYYKVKQEIDSIKYEKALVELAKMNFKPDKVNSPNVYDLIKKEFENFTADELKLPAFSDSQSGISTINAHNEGMPVVKFNTNSWNRALPETAVQFMSMEYKPRAKQELADFKHDNNGLIDYVGLFTNNLPVEQLGKLIHIK